ncbi:hypothetical protein GCM10008020_03260 [Massilia psychrophila]|nr:hypothetical protein GCM10008020_03260 [Massilia psychrophila]
MSGAMAAVWACEEAGACSAIRTSESEGSESVIRRDIDFSTESDWLGCIVADAAAAGNRRATVLPVYVSGRNDSACAIGQYSPNTGGSRSLP